jgi:hypothetical protein
MFQTPQEKIGMNSRKEIERLTFLTSQYAKDCKISFLDAISHIMEKAGYKKHNYIPCDNDNLFTITQLSIKYMRVYAIRPEQFIQTLLNSYEYCNKYGYSFDITQTQLKTGDINEK